MDIRAGAWFSRHVPLADPPVPRPTLRFASHFVATAGMALAWPGAAAGGDVRSFHTIEYKFLRHGRTEWYAGGGLRFNDGLGRAYDRRGYAGAAIDFGSGVEADISYLFRYRESGDLGLKPNRRATVSLQYPLYEGRWALTGTTNYERHFAAPVEPDFNRYRQRFEIERKAARSTPWLSWEMAFRREGPIRSRSRAGWKWRTAAGHEVSLAYQFESVKSGNAWAPRHAIVTAFEFTRLRRE